MQAATLMDVDDRPSDLDSSSALAQAPPPEARATAQNGSLSPSEQSRAQDGLALGFAVLYELGGEARGAHAIQLPPVADSLDFDLLDGLSRAVAVVWTGARCEADRARFGGDRQILLDHARGQGLTGLNQTLAYVAARAFHLSPDLRLFNNEDVGKRDAQLKIGKRLHTAHASNTLKLQAWDKARRRRQTGDTSDDERITFIRSLGCSVTRAELEVAFALAPPAPPPASPPSAQSAAATPTATPVSQREIAMNVTEYTVTLEILTRSSQLEAHVLQLKHMYDDARLHRGLAESNALAAETAAVVERERAERIDTTCKKLLADERKKAQRAITGASTLFYFIINTLM